MESGKAETIEADGRRVVPKGRGDALERQPDFSLMEEMPSRDPWQIVVTGVDDRVVQTSELLVE